MQDRYEDDLASDQGAEPHAFEQAGEAWDEAGDGFEAEGMDEGYDAEGMDEYEGMEAAGDGMEELDAAADEWDGMESSRYAEGMEEAEAAQGFEGMEEAEGAQGFEEAEALDTEALEDALANAMDAADEDEFFGRLVSIARQLRTAGAPILRRIAKRALPIGARLVRQVARSAAPLGGVVGQELGRAAGGWLSGLLDGGDAMDAFADVAADLAGSVDDIDEFVPVLGGLAGRYVVRRALRNRARLQPSQVRALGRAAARAVVEAARAITARRGPAALRSVPRLVRQATHAVQRRGASPRAVPAMIRRMGTRVAGSARAAARLSRPNAAARQLRARAGLRAGATRGTAQGRSAGRRGRVQTLYITGPVRIVTSGTVTRR